ncbi:hypothetical protein Mapa_004641 [Marchantia paleacea]|nr:hypothetical protein Mapa_004641 [Marchantia paleacea]
MHQFLLRQYKTTSVKACSFSVDKLPSRNNYYSDTGLVKTGEAVSHYERCPREIAALTDIGMSSHNQGLNICVFSLQTTWASEKWAFQHDTLNAALD